jgi:hypothetical protein
MESSKKCTKCGEVKPLEEFYKSKRSKGGRVSACKSCYKAYNEANKDKRIAYYKAHYEANKDKKKAYRKAYDEANKEKVKAHKKVHYQANKEKYKAYKEANKDKRNAHLKNRRKTDLHFRMTTIIRHEMYRWKNGSTIEMIGISFQEFADMYGTGEGMHLDHKIPMSWFDIDNADHNKVCQHHTNLQWLTPEENISKKNFYADVNGTKVLRKDFDLEAYVRDMLKKLA